MYLQGMSKLETVMLCYVKWYSGIFFSWSGRGWIRGNGKSEGSIANKQPKVGRTPSVTSHPPPFRTPCILLYGTSRCNTVCKAGTIAPLSCRQFWWHNMTEESCYPYLLLFSWPFYIKYDIRYFHTSMSSGEKKHLKERHRWENYIHSILFH